MTRKNNQGGVSNPAKAPRLVIAGGKTGGHLFPGIAVAQALEQLAPDARIRFIGTKASFETRTLGAYGYHHTAISARPIKGKGLWDKIMAASAVGISTFQALVSLVGNRPDFVLGVGGFSSFSVVLAARILGIPTAIQEQNAFPGMTNRMLARITRTIFTGFEHTRGFEHHPKTIFTGNPVRLAGPGEALPSPSGSGEEPQEAAHEQVTDTESPIQAGPKDFILLVTGGSQGASSINQAMVQALPGLAKTQNLFIIHQTGISQEKDVKAAYDQWGIPSRVAAFFQEMPSLQELAHLVVCRSGAGTVSELCLKGLPSILIPFPHAADDHQTWNARAMADHGGARFIPDGDLSGPRLLEMIQDLRQDETQRNDMAEKARDMAMPGAAHTIARHILAAGGFALPGNEAPNVPN